MDNTTKWKKGNPFNFYKIRQENIFLTLGVSNKKIERDSKSTNHKEILIYWINEIKLCQSKDTIKRVKGQTQDRRKYFQ